MRRLALALPFLSVAVFACNPPPRTEEFPPDGDVDASGDVSADDTTAPADDSGSPTDDSATSADTGSAPTDTGAPDTTVPTDHTPPTIAPTLTVTNPTIKGFTLTWTAASDDVTAPNLIQYDIYVGVAAGGETANTTVTGTNTTTLNTLSSDTAYFIFVRARDQAGNHADTMEATGTTLVSFVGNVQPLFTLNCAVGGCHVPGSPPDNLDLASGFSYGLLVNVPSVDSTAAGDSPVLNRVTPGDHANSVLDRKVHGDPNPPATYQLMPPPITGSALTSGQKQLIRDWIDQGALNN